MTGWQIILALFLGLLIISACYIGFRYVSYQLDQKWPEKVLVAPVTAVEPVQHVPEHLPPMAWWDELEALRSQFGTLQTKVHGQLTTADNHLKLARASEERARKMLAKAGLDGDGAVPALPVLQPGGWENEEVMAPVGRQLSILDQRRAR